MSRVSHIPCPAHGDMSWIGHYGPEQEYRINSPQALNTYNSHQSFPNVMSWYKSSQRETSSALLGWQSQAQSCAFWSAIFWHLECELLAFLCGWSNLVTQSCARNEERSRFPGFSSVSLKEAWSADAFFFSILPSLWLPGTCLCQREEPRICTEPISAPHASLGSICFLVYLSPLQSPREDNLSDMPHLVYSRPLKS